MHAPGQHGQLPIGLQALVFRTKRGRALAFNHANSVVMCAGSIAVQPAVASPGVRQRWAKMQLPRPGVAFGLCSMTKPSR